MKLDLYVGSNSNSDPADTSPMDSNIADHASNWVAELIRMGIENKPLLIIDNFAPDPLKLKRDATNLSFSRLNPHYPGVRAPVPSEYLSTQLPPLLPWLKDVFGYRSAPRVTECYYSITTTKPAALKPLQCLPHFDGGGDDKIALLHYLCPTESGGTAFYRHRTTGFETVTDERYYGFYVPALTRDAETHGMPPQQYFREDTAMFERIATCNAAFNRAVVYFGANLHSIDVPENYSFDPSPVTGRLTINTFLLPA